MKRWSHTLVVVLRILIMSDRETVGKKEADKPWTEILIAF